MNCWFVNLTKPEDFSWMFERLMLGGGVGFSVTNSEALGRVRQGTVQHLTEPDADYIVPDKREGGLRPSYRPSERIWGARMIRPT